MPVDMEVGLGPGHIVLDGDPARPLAKNRGHIFGPCLLLWTNGWMNQDVNWYEGRPRPRLHCVRSFGLRSSFHDVYVFSFKCALLTVISFRKRKWIKAAFAYVKLEVRFECFFLLKVPNVLRNL